MICTPVKRCPIPIRSRTTRVGCHRQVLEVPACQGPACDSPPVVGATKREACAKEPYIRPLCCLSFPKEKSSAAQYLPAPEAQMFKIKELPVVGFPSSAAGPPNRRPIISFHTGPPSKFRMYVPHTNCMETRNVFKGGPQRVKAYAYSQCLGGRGWLRLVSSLKL